MSRHMDLVLRSFNRTSIQSYPRMTCRKAVVVCLLSSGALVVWRQTGAHGLPFSLTNPERKIEVKGRTRSPCLRRSRRSAWPTRNERPSVPDALISYPTGIIDGFSVSGSIRFPRSWQPAVRGFCERSRCKRLSGLGSNQAKTCPRSWVWAKGNRDVGGWM